MTYCVGLIGVRSWITTVRHYDLSMVDAKKRPRGGNMVVLEYRMASAVRIVAILACEQAFLSLYPAILHGC